MCSYVVCYVLYSVHVACIMVHLKFCHRLLFCIISLFTGRIHQVDRGKTVLLFLIVIKLEYIPYMEVISYTPVYHYTEITVVCVCVCVCVCV